MQAWALPGQGRPYLARPVEVLPVLGEAVKGEEGVAVPGRAVADAVALAQQAALPDHVAALHGVLQVLLLLENLGEEKQSGVGTGSSEKS